jgi:hypothetical protein
MLASQPDQHAAVVAQVEWQDGFRVVAVRVGTRESQQNEWISGKVVFDEDDAIADRWTTAGFTIATLVGDLELPEPAPQPEPAPPTETRPAPVAPPANKEASPTHDVKETKSSARRLFQLALGGTFGQAMVDQGLRAGPWLALTYAPFSMPIAARARGAMSFAEEGDTAVRWSTVSAGVEFNLPLAGGVAATAGAEGGLSVVSASSGGQASRVSGLLCLLLGVEVALGGPLRAVVAGELSLAPATHLSTADDREITDRRAKLSALAGLELEL